MAAESAPEQHEGAHPRADFSFLSLVRKLDGELKAGGAFAHDLCDRVIDPDGVHAQEAWARKQPLQVNGDAGRMVAAASCRLRLPSPDVSRLQRLAEDLLSGGQRWVEAPGARQASSPDVAIAGGGVLYRPGAGTMDAVVRVLAMLSSAKGRAARRDGVLASLPCGRFEDPRPVLSALRPAAAPTRPAKPPSPTTPVRPTWTRWLSQPADSPQSSSDAEVRVMAGLVMHLRPDYGDPKCVTERDAARAALDCIAGRGGALFLLESDSFSVTQQHVTIPGWSPAALKSRLSPVADLGTRLLRLQRQAQQLLLGSSETLVAVARCIDDRITVWRSDAVGSQCQRLLSLGKATSRTQRESELAARLLLREGVTAAGVMEQLNGELHRCSSLRVDEPWTAQLHRAALAPLLQAADDMMHGAYTGTALDCGGLCPAWEGEPVPAFIRRVVAEAAAAAAGVRDVLRLCPQHPALRVRPTPGPDAPHASEPVPAPAPPLVQIGIASMCSRSDALLAPPAADKPPEAADAAPLSAAGFGLTVSALKAAAQRMATVAAVRREQVAAELRREEAERAAAVLAEVEPDAAVLDLPPDWGGSLAYRSPRRVLPDTAAIAAAVAPPPRAAESGGHPLGQSVLDDPALLAEAKARVEQEYAAKFARLGAALGAAEEDQPPQPAAQAPAAAPEAGTDEPALHTAAARLGRKVVRAAERPAAPAPLPPPATERSPPPAEAPPAEQPAAPPAEQPAAPPAEQPAAAALPPLAPSDDLPAAHHLRHSVVLMGSEYGTPLRSRGPPTPSARQHHVHSVQLGDDSQRESVRESSRGPEPKRRPLRALKRKRRSDPTPARQGRGPPLKLRRRRGRPAEREPSGFVLRPMHFSDEAPYRWGSSRAPELRVSTEEEYESPSDCTPRRHAALDAGGAVSPRGAQATSSVGPTESLQLLLQRLRKERQTGEHWGAVDAEEAEVPRAAASPERRDVAALADPSATLVPPEELAGTGCSEAVPLPVALAGTLRRAAVTQREHIVSAVHHAVLHTASFPQHAAWLFAVYLADDGGFLGAVTDAMAEHGGRTPSVHGLHAALTHAVAAVRVPAGDGPRSCFSVTVGRGRGVGQRGPAHYVVGYTPPEGLASVLTERSLKTLRTAHTILVALRRGVRAATDCLRIMARPPKHHTVPVSARQRVRLCAVRFDCQRLLQALHDATADCLRAASASYLNLLADVAHAKHPRSFEEYRQSWEQLVSGVRRCTWQGPEAAAQKQQIDSAIVAALELPALASSFVQGCLPEQSAAPFERRIRFARQSLVSALSEAAHGGAAADDGDSSWLPDARQWSQLLLARVAPSHLTPK
eukprot:TRINITY_DN3441_c0_g1_i1.p1 TRINITY_DN3441_c0_g1~~TRINITY_DN3441_c0_g1_i1.p1  ORF type:complete len:1367 (+),score=475.59 TRINITY_DN3441_c0_g1_i1:94-4101(+)